MRRILRSGPPVFRITCGGCGVDFSYELADVYPNAVLGTECVLCPKCGRVIPHVSGSFKLVR